MAGAGAGVLGVLAALVKTWTHVEIVKNGAKIPVLVDAIEKAGGLPAITPEVLASSHKPQRLPGEPRPDVQHPGIRGGKWYRDKRGRVRYGTPPAGESAEILEAIGPEHVQYGSRVTGLRGEEALSGTVTQWGHAGVTIHVQSPKGDYETRLRWADLRTVEPPAAAEDETAPKTAKARRAREAIAQALTLADHPAPNPFGFVHGPFAGIEQPADAAQVEGQAITWLKIKQTGELRTWRAVFTLTEPTWRGLTATAQQALQSGGGSWGPTVRSVPLQVTGGLPKAAGGGLAETEAQVLDFDTSGLRFTEPGVQIDFANPASPHVAKAAAGLVIAEVTAATPAEAAQRLHDAFADRLGLPDLFDSPDPTAVRAYQYARAVWQAVPAHATQREVVIRAAQAFAAGREDEAGKLLDLTPAQAKHVAALARSLKKVQVSPGYSTYAVPGRGQRFIAAHPQLRGLLHDLYSVKALPSILANGLFSTLGRWTRGLAATGQSSSSDLDRGSADMVDTRLWRERFSHLVSGATVLIQAEQLDRTDWYAYHEDRYGEIDTEAFAQRDPPERFLARQHQESGGTSGNEVLVRRTIPPEAFAQVLVEPGRADEVDTMLRDAGLTTVGGRPLDEVVQIGKAVDHPEQWMPLAAWRARNTVAQAWAGPMAAWLAALTPEQIGVTDPADQTQYRDELQAFHHQFETLQTGGSLTTLGQALRNLAAVFPLGPDQPEAYEALWGSVPPMGDALAGLLQTVGGGLPDVLNPARRQELIATARAKKRKRELEGKINGITQAYLGAVVQALASTPTGALVGQAITKTLEAQGKPKPPHDEESPGAYPLFGTLMRMLAQSPSLPDWVEQIPPLPADLEDYLRASHLLLPDLFVPEKRALRVQQALANHAASTWMQAVNPAAFDPTATYTPNTIAETIHEMIEPALDWETAAAKLPPLPPALRAQVEAVTSFPAFLRQADSPQKTEALQVKHLSTALTKTLKGWTYTGSDPTHLVGAMLGWTTQTERADGPATMMNRLAAFTTPEQREYLTGLEPELAKRLDPAQVAIRQAAWAHQAQQRAFHTQLDQTLMAWLNVPGWHTKGTVKFTIQNQYGPAGSGETPADFFGTPHLAIRPELQSRWSKTPGALDWVPKPQGDWSVVHAPSGAEVLRFETRAEAALAAWRLGALADWSGKDLETVRAAHPGLQPITEALKDDPRAFLPEPWAAKEAAAWTPPGVEQARQAITAAGTKTVYARGLGGEALTGTLIEDHGPTATVRFGDEPPVQKLWSELSSTPLAHKPVLKPKTKGSGLVSGTAKIHVREDDHLVPALLQGGLAVHREWNPKTGQPKKSGAWIITHAGSGLSLGFRLKKQADAEAIVAQLLRPELGFDFTAAKDAVLKRNPFLYEAVTWLRNSTLKDNTYVDQPRVGEDLLPVYQAWQAKQAAPPALEWVQKSLWS